MTSVIQLSRTSRHGFRERGALGHLCFWGPTQVLWPIWPFGWKAWKYGPLTCRAQGCSANKRGVGMRPKN